MILSCPICQEVFVPTCDAVVNKCGHLFHLFCLQKWFDSCGKRPKTCPQCRAPARDSDVIKLFFNISESASNNDDPATLQCKLDSANFQMQLKETELKKLRDGINEEKKKNKQLRKMVLDLEQSNAGSNSLILVLKQQIREFSAQNAINEKLKAENRTLEHELEVLNDLRTVVKGNTEAVNQMLENYQNPKALAVMVSTMKKELVNQNAKKGRLEKQIKSLQNELRENEQKIRNCDNRLLQQQVKYDEAQRKIKELENKLSHYVNESSAYMSLSVNLVNDSTLETSTDDSNLRLHDSSKNNTISNLMAECPSPILLKKQHSKFDDNFKLKPKDIDLNKKSKPLESKTTSSHSINPVKKLKVVNHSNSLLEELEKARSSTSPYLKLSQGSCLGKRRALGSILTNETSDIRVLKKPRLLSEKFDSYTPLPEEAFSGNGGAPPIDEFPKPRKSFMSKHNKLKRLAPLGIKPDKPTNDSIIDLL